MKQPVILVICKVRDLKSKIDAALRDAETEGNPDAAWLRGHI